MWAPGDQTPEGTSVRGWVVEFALAAVHCVPVEMPEEMDEEYHRTVATAVIWVSRRVNPAAPVEVGTPDPISVQRPSSWPTGEAGRQKARALVEVRAMATWIRWGV
jgi:hypothetical protein